MKNLSLALKIGGGFTFVLLLLIIVSGTAWDGLSKLTDGFMNYRRLAHETNLAGRLQANMLMVRMNVKNFIITGSEQDKEQYAAYVKKMDGFLEDAHQDIQDHGRAKKIDFIDESIVKYKAAFARVIELRKERDRIFNSILQTTGPDIEKNLSEIMFSAKTDNKAEAVYEADIVLRHLLLGRLYGLKFLDSNSEEDKNRTEAEFLAFFDGLKKLDTLLQNPYRRKLIQHVEQKAQKYIQGFEDLNVIIFERNELFANTLDIIGPKIAAAVEDVKLSVKNEQDELGLRLQRQSKMAVRIVLSISCLVLIFGAAISFVLTKSITAPIKRAADFVQKLAGGDFTSRLSVRQKDEIGTMSEALNTMVSDLGQMIRNIAQGVGTLASSSTELTSISSQLLSASCETSGKAESVAAATEEMSTNINSVSAAMEESSANTGMVASAAEEMSATISEIASSAERARAVSENAVGQSRETSEKMSELGESAKNIGKVTETITEISEQTNLLALNATIEAARAGEAGKGFAVVANEIKDLARQTAEATVDIKNQIQGMQSTTQSTVKDMNAIAEVIDEVNRVIISIASAVEQQAAATTEISTNVAQVSAGINEVNQNVAESTVVVSDITQEVAMVSQSALQVDSGSAQIQTSAENLAKLAEQLDMMVKKFTV